MAPSANQKLEGEDHARDAAFNKAMHGKSAQAKGGIAAMFSKGGDAKQAAVDEYFKHWDNKPAENETAEERAVSLCEQCDKEHRANGIDTGSYYNLATDLYEYGWGQSFHFCRFSIGEPFHQAIARHEHYLAHSIGIKEGMKVLDVGCGVGGPAREIAKFTGCHVTGLNNNDYQIDRATHYAAKEGLSKQLDFVKGDFMQMSFPDNSFDAVYAIEATVHAPTLKGIYSEIFRVLKPGGVFGVYEWLMTDEYDNDNIHHREIRLGIEQGDGISNMCKVQEALDAIKDSGFEMLQHEDLADRPDPSPWYWPLSGEMRYIQSVGDFFTIVRMTKWGRFIAHNLAGALETIRVAPAGTKKTADSLALAADCLVAGGKEHLFTPMYLMVARKPE
ncbi:sterol 24-C-methyltransferase [Cordyceps militaris CM01]|uniref:Sterol 24-C-methyltransferase n=2 Tax=Cordyceps militaris TaxID=73501 RepID=G3JRK8_CORMM|nr:sterol 24-C-methyltransferase [Cordyceps militaris CM01]ATY62377.1 sterol 24-C-methyltransferase [Cordyceps militaris]EGX88611.1 sterol 24-C-methyltransferase [Cordyceps militaris CM01]